MIKQIISLTLAFSLATVLYGAENKPKKPTKTSVKSTEAPKEQIKIAIPNINENEFEVSKSEIMPNLEKNQNSVNKLERNHASEVVIDLTTKLMWSDDVKTSSESLTWKDAIKYCEKLKLAGYTDWKLATITQYSTIHDLNNRFPSSKDGFENIKDRSYWSSDLGKASYFHGKDWGACIDDFDQENVSILENKLHCNTVGDKTNERNLLCVRKLK